MIRLLHIFLGVLYGIGSVFVIGFAISVLTADDRTWLSMLGAFTLLAALPFFANILISRANS